MSIDAYITTHSGKKFHFLQPRPGDICIEDIAMGLAMQCRYNGQLGSPSKFYSIAQHSCLVAARMPVECAIHGLMHDAAEAYIGDMAAPIKACFPGFARFEDNVMAAIYEQLELEPPNTLTKDLIKLYDRDILYSEGEALFADPDLVREWTLFRNFTPQNTWTIRPWTPTQAYHQFMADYMRMQL